MTKEQIDKIKVSNNNVIAHNLACVILLCDDFAQYKQYDNAFLFKRDDTKNIYDLQKLVCLEYR